MARRMRKLHKACKQCLDRCMRIHSGSSSPDNCSHPPAPLSFFKVMVGNFTETLFVPPKFSQTLHYLIDDDEVFIEDTNGIRWRIVASLLNGSLAFVDGWQKFVIDHEINLGNFVVFKVAGKIISAQIFDLSAWEKLDFFENYQPHRLKRKRGGQPSTSWYESVRRSPQTVEEQQCIADEQSPERENRTVAVVPRDSSDAEFSPGCLLSEFNEQPPLPIGNSNHVNGCFEGSNTFWTRTKEPAVARADVVSGFFTYADESNPEVAASESFQNVLVAEYSGRNEEVLSYNEHGPQESQTLLLSEYVEVMTEGMHGLAIAEGPGNEKNLHTLDIGPIDEGVQLAQVPKTSAETMIDDLNMGKATNDCLLVSYTPNIEGTAITVIASRQETLCNSMDFKNVDSGNADTCIFPPNKCDHTICASQQMIRENLTSACILGLPVRGPLSVPGSSEKKNLTQSSEDSHCPKRTGEDSHQDVAVLSRSMIIVSHKNLATLEGRSSHCVEKKDACGQARLHKDKTENTDSVSPHSPKNERFRFSVHVKSLTWQELPSKLPFILIRKNQKRKVLMLVDSCSRMWPVLYLRGKEFNGFAAGWQDFARANNLHPGDKCDFELFMSHEKMLKVLLHRS